MIWFKSKGFFGKQREVTNAIIAEFLHQQRLETNSYPSIDDDDGIMLSGSFKPYAATTEENRTTGEFTLVYMLCSGEAMTEHRASLALSEDLKSISYGDAVFSSDNDGLSMLVAFIVSLTPEDSVPENITGGGSAEG